MEVASSSLVTRSILPLSSRTGVFLYPKYPLSSVENYATLENMDLTPENIVFDNAFLIVYQPEQLPLLVATAVMAARELARDRDT